MIKAICLDLFHTLVDVGQVPETIGRFTADILGVERERWNAACFGDAHEITRPTDHYTAIRLMAHSLDPDIPHELLQQAVLERQRRFDYALQQVDTEVLEALSELRELGLKLALVSNASSSEVAAWHDSPLAGCFHSAIFSCDVGMKKPQPDIYHHALKSLGVEAKESLFVGDGGSDEHLGARRAGLTPVLITRHIREAEKLQQQRLRVDYEIANLPELVALVRQQA